MSRIHLNRRFVLEEELRLPDGAGGYASSWRVLGTVWAMMEAGTGREVSLGDRRAPKVPLTITVRALLPEAPGRPKAGQRFREAGRSFRILAVAERDRRGMYLTCHAEEDPTP